MFVCLKSFKGIDWNVFEILESPMPPVSFGINNITHSNRIVIGLPTFGARVTVTFCQVARNPLPLLKGYTQVAK